MNVQALCSSPQGLAFSFPPERFSSGFISGQSDESEMVFRRYAEAANHFSQPFSRLRSDPIRRFYELLWTWREETKVLSDIDAVCTHPAYQQIIGMGRGVLPLIFRELQSGHDYWFWALKAITGEDPVPHQDRGRITKMKQYWLNWWANEVGAF